MILARRRSSRDGLIWHSQITITRQPLCRNSRCSPLVSGGVAPHLGDPVVAPRRRHSAPGATVHVPETAVDVDDFPQSRENEIGCAGERADVQTVTVSQGMDQPPDHQFRSCVLRLDRRHDAGSFGLRERVRHVIRGQLIVPILGACLTGR